MHSATLLRYKLFYWHHSESFPTSGVSPQKGAYLWSFSKERHRVRCERFWAANHCFVPNTVQHWQPPKFHTISLKFISWLPVNCLQIGQVGFHVEVKESKCKSRLSFPESWVRLKSSQVEGVILHLVVKIQRQIRSRKQDS